MSCTYPLPKGTPEYGVQCLNHSMRNCGLVIDKITLSAPLSCFDASVLNIRHPAFNILQYGNYISVAVVGEVICPDQPMFVPVIQVLQVLWSMNAFEADVGNMLAIYLGNFGYFSCQPGFIDGLISTLRRLGFKYTALELAFDFVGYTVPLSVRDASQFIKKDTTYYTKDYRESPKNKGNQVSLIAFYDRKKKLAEDSGGYPPLPQGMEYKRLEYRVKQLNGRRWLHLDDLRHNMYSYIEAYGSRIRRKADKLVGDALSWNAQFIPDALSQLLTLNSRELSDIPSFPY